MMLRAMVGLALLVLSVAAAPAAEAVFPLGSRIGLAPPPGFLPSKHFPGFENPDNEASIVLVTLPAQAFAEVEATMSPDAVRSQGVVEDVREVLPLSNGRGLLVGGVDEENGKKIRKWLFLGAVPEGTVLTAVRVPESAWATYPDDVIRTSLVTLTVRPSVPIAESVELLPFRFTDLSGMRAVRALGGAGVLLTDGPKDAPEASEQPLFLASIGQGGPEGAAERAAFARNLFTGFADFTDLHIVSSDMLRLGGGSLPTHELQAEAKDGRTGAAMKLVQWVRFGAGGYVRMVGIARTDLWLASFSRFRTIRDGIASRE
jgi:hypothetical protein